MTTMKVGTRIAQHLTAALCGLGVPERTISEIVYRECSRIADEATTGDWIEMPNGTTYTLTFKPFDKRERDAIVKAATEDMLVRESGGNVFAKTYKSGKDKYGRYLAEIFYTNAQGIGMNLGEQLLTRGLAKPYAV